jgi:hypothetical protein
LVIAEPVNVIVVEPDVQVEAGVKVFAESAGFTVIKVKLDVEPQLPVPPLYTAL